MLNHEGLHDLDDRSKSMEEVGGNSKGWYLYYEHSTDKYWLSSNCEPYRWEETKEGAKAFKRTIVDSKRGPYYHKAKF